jgi:hypothetical protein
MIFLLAVFLITACTPREGTVRVPVVPTAAPTSEYLERPFAYDKVQKYDYKMLSYTADKELITHFVQTVASEGSTWHITSESRLDGIDMGANFGYTEVWFDQSTDKCTRARNVLSLSGNETYTSAPCGPAITYGSTPDVQYPYLGEESVTTPLGTFATKKYGLPGASVFYMAPQFDVPVKIVYGTGTKAPGSLFYELEKYE